MPINSSLREKTMRHVISTLTALFMLTGFSFAADLPSATETTIRAALASGKPTVADFGARTCIPCKKMAPILAELDREQRGKANILFTDVHESKNLAANYRIQMIPTKIFFDAKGKEVKRHIGFMEKADILKELHAAGLK
jgi:thioredoxin 1